jgi:hypothetical protein
LERWKKKNGSSGRGEFAREAARKTESEGVLDLGRKILVTDERDENALDAAENISAMDVKNAHASVFRFAEKERYGGVIFILPMNHRLNTGRYWRFRDLLEANFFGDKEKALDFFARKNMPRATESVIGGGGLDFWIPIVSGQEKLAARLEHAKTFLKEGREAHAVFDDRNAEGEFAARVGKAGVREIAAMQVIRFAEGAVAPAPELLAEAQTPGERGVDAVEILEAERGEKIERETVAAAEIEDARARRNFFESFEKKPVVPIFLR